jgi:anion-transporting  ArsA/GET3 family ATPase
MGMKGKSGHFIWDLKSDFIIVTIPEALGVRQTERIIKDFDEYQLKVNHLIINYVIQRQTAISIKLGRKCSKTISDVGKAVFSKIGLIELPLMPQE